MAEKNVDWCEKLDEWKTNFYKGDFHQRTKNYKYMQMSRIW